MRTIRSFVMIAALTCAAAACMDSNFAGGDKSKKDDKKGATQTGTPTVIVPEGETKPLPPSINPNEIKECESTDTSVVKVSEKDGCVLHGVDKGEADVIVTLEDGTKATVPVKVIDDTDTSDDDTDDLADDTNDDGTPHEETLPDGTNIQLDESQASISCVLSLDYSPEQVSCQIGLSEPNVWGATDGWKTLQTAFQDRQALWISPLTATMQGANKLCPFLDKVQKLFYVSHFDAPSDGSYQIEAITDDIGFVMLWESGSHKKEVFRSSPNAGTRGSVTLKQTRYAIIVSAMDISSVATGMVVSIKGPDGSIVKRSLSDGSWCIYRVSSSEDPKVFLPKVAGCNKCFGTKR